MGTRRNRNVTQGQMSGREEQDRNRANRDGNRIAMAPKWHGAARLRKEGSSVPGSPGHPSHLGHERPSWPGLGS